VQLIQKCENRDKNPTNRILRNVCNMVGYRKEYERESLETLDNARIFSVVSKFSQDKSKQFKVENVEFTEEPPSKTNINLISKRGGVITIQKLCEKYGSTLLDRIPALWEFSSAKLRNCIEISLDLISRPIDDLLSLLLETEILSNLLMYIEGDFRDKVTD
jgi:hypothetical protein